MLGGVGCGAGRSWCSELWGCSSKVAPHATTPGLAQMADCDQCSNKFNLLRRRKICGVCGLTFCGECLKRSQEGGRRCNKCVVLAQWPLDISDVTALRVKDLRHFLHSRHINTNTCTEKRDLIDLVTRHISSQHQSGPGQGTVPTRPQTPSQERVKPQPHTNNTTTRDDGIRVRPSMEEPRNVWPTTRDTNTATGNAGSGNVWSGGRDVGSIRVRPMDSIRVRPVRSSSPIDSPDYDPETDLGIRVFASEVTRHREDYSPEDNHTTSCCSLDSCLHSQHSPTSPQNSGVDNIGFVLQPGELGTPDSQPQSSDNNRGHMDGASAGDENTTGPSVLTNDSTLPTAPSQQELEEDEDQQPPLSSASAPPSTSSSSQPSAASSPEPAKAENDGSALSRIVALGDLKGEKDIEALSVRQCKELLSLHRVTYSGVREKSELLAKIKLLWRDHQITRKEMETLPEELVCKICMDSAIDCVLLECGHMVACTPCGKQMSECPVCRQYVVRVVRTFRA
ncbi:hypothetical protein Pmani_026592 [Petrolisthes manimaculis]|uniref:RING-type domain-containing protein n=1 Tax=Petrolisthes manimaculis TaxID=1843537 RepID=A0AAE1P5I0_9EUCA|nr:hypothetical protein Pmani_026592 [Petrolisthes manimaculis]